eukprot:245287-Alexandrium_andersonii.AAC.1
MGACLPATRGCASTLCCKAETRQERTSRPGQPSIPPPSAQLSFAVLRPSILARVGVDRRLCSGSWTAAGR